MARDRKRFNVKGRESKKVEIVKDPAQQISVENDTLNGGKYDESNPLLLPSKKQKTIVKSANDTTSKKFLSKKQRKKLQQIVSRREKKSGRAELLEELQKYQLPSETFDKLTPLVQIQTEGLKKLFANIEKDKNRAKKEEENGFNDDGDDISVKKGKLKGKDKKNLPQRVKSSIKGANKAKFQSWSGRFIGGAKGVDKVDNKILGFDNQEDSSTEEEESDEEVQVKTEPDDQDEDNVSSDVEMVANEEENEDNVEILVDPSDEEEIEEMEMANELPTEKVVQEPKNKKKKKLSSKGAEDQDIVDAKLKRKKQSSPPKGELEVVGVKVRKTFVPVNRTKEIELVRSKLPIIPEEQIIMESITDNLVTVLAGETGSGKTTQLPQFLYEAGYALNGKIIGITEPRRVAAISMSSRVATELNLPSSVVSYQIRFDGNVTPSTKIKFMTDGVLLKEMERDFLLSKYSVICVDEAHERSLYTDILIGLLSRCVLIRQKRKDPLKLIIMSATLRVNDFLENQLLFPKGPPGMVHVPTRQFPVQVHFSKKTPDNYITAAGKKTVQIHRKLPPGGILVFVTGQQEVRTMVKKLRQMFPTTSFQSDSPDSKKSPRKNLKRKKSLSTSKTPNLRTFDLNKLQKMPLKAQEEEDEEDCDDFESDQEDQDDSNDWDCDPDGSEGSRDPLYVLPLYSMLPNSEQQKVFQPPPPGTRLCVISTNVAETSLTIPSIRYVVDCGKVKLKVWDKITGVQRFAIQWESKASAEQRAGRAGRTGPGHCYRLFSSAVFDGDFEQYSLPEIQVRPVDDMILLMKSMSIDKVQNFPFPSAPSSDQLLAAEKTLLGLGALEEIQNRENRYAISKKKLSGDNTLITELGKTMAHFPLGPRFSKMLALSFHHSLVEFTVALVSALTVQEIFLEASLHESTKELKSGWSVIRRKWAGTGSSFLLGDCMVLLRAVGAFEYSGGSSEFCLKMGLRQKAMLEIRKLRRQLTSDVNMLLGPGQEIPLNPQMQPPTEEQATLLRQILLSGLPDRVARKIHESELKEGEDPKVYRHAYRCGELEDPVFLHQSSILRASSPSWVVYQEIFETDGKLYIRGLTSIDPDWIPTFCLSLCRLGPALSTPPPFYDGEKGHVKCWVKSTYGKQGWELPQTTVEYPLCLEKFKIFAQFLLNGDVFPKLEKFRGKLLSLPVTMTKTWAKLQKRTQTFLQALTENGIHQKELLEKKWKEDKSFLLKEYLEWLNDDDHESVKRIWPPLDG